ncbi:MAG: protein kinase [Planctomycetes bacterium]|nr:protein kinase [Planctomycetota bacterium]
MPAPASEGPNPASPPSEGLSGHAASPGGGDEVERFRRLRQVFEAAQQLPVEHRPAYVDGAALDPAMAAELHEMLQHAGTPTAELHNEEFDAVLAGQDSGPAPPIEDELLDQLPEVRGRRVLDPYVILRPVGGGGFGQVYRARHLWIGKDVAIKLLRTNFATSRESLELLRREARLGASLASRNIVEVLDCNLRDGLHYLVMEWIHGEDLTRRVRRLGARPLAEVLSLWRDLANALADAHSRSVVHRDVNPNNVLLAHDGTAKLTDLGLARHFRDPQMLRSQQAVGTPAFMAPEQFDSLLDAGPAADIYSAAATAYYLFTAETLPRDSRYRIDWAEVDDRLPAEVVALLRECLTVSPAERIGNGRHLRDEIERLIADLGVGPEIAAETLAFADDDALDHRAETELARVRDELQAARGATAGGDGSDDAAAVDPAADRRSRRAARWSAGTLLVAVAMLLLIWRPWQPPPPSAGDEAAPGSGHTATTANGELAKMTADGSSSGAAPPGRPQPDGEVVDHADPDRSTAGQPASAPTPPSIAAVSVEGGTRIDDVDQMLAFAVPAIPFGEVDRRDILVHLQGEVADADELTLLDHAGLEPVLQDGSWRFTVELSPGTSEFTVALHGQSRPLRIVIPSIPPAVAGLLLATGDDRTGVHYRLPLPGEVDPLRFVWIKAGLLAGVTEVSRGQFAAFVDSGDYATMLAADVTFGRWLDARRLTLESRQQFWREELNRRDLPVTLVHACEAVAFARWVSRGLEGCRAIVPSAELWRTVANLNCERPASATGELPFPGDAKTNANIRFNRGTFRGSDGSGTTSHRAGLEGIWGRPSGLRRLCHLGGNAEELCVERYVEGDGDTSPAIVTWLGGAFDDMLPRLRIPGTAELDLFHTDPGSPEPRHEPLTNGGFRLVIVSNPN